MQNYWIQQQCQSITQSNILQMPRTQIFELNIQFSRVKMLLLKFFVFFCFINLSYFFFLKVD